MPQVMRTLGTLQEHHKIANSANSGRREPPLPCGRQACNALCYQYKRPSVIPVCPNYGVGLGRVPSTRRG